MKNSTRSATLHQHDISYDVSNGRNVTTDLSLVDAAWWSEESFSSANNLINFLKIEFGTSGTCHVVVYAGNME